MVKANKVFSIANALNIYIPLSIFFFRSTLAFLAFSISIVFLSFTKLNFASLLVFPSDCECESLPE